jgi:hypothetical protein
MLRDLGGLRESNLQENFKIRESQEFHKPKTAISCSNYHRKQQFRSIYDGSLPIAAFSIISIHPI